MKEYAPEEDKSLRMKIGEGKLNIQYSTNLRQGYGGHARNIQ